MDSRCFLALSLCFFCLFPHVSHSRVRIPNLIDHKQTYLSTSLCNVIYLYDFFLSWSDLIGYCVHFQRGIGAQIEKRSFFCHLRSNSCHSALMESQVFFLNLHFHFFLLNFSLPLLGNLFPLLWSAGLSFTRVFFLRRNVIIWSLW